MNILRNQQNKNRLKPGTLLLPNTQLSTDDKLKYALGVFQDYKRYGGEACNDLRGKKILELGPGDNHVVALQFLLAGASHVTALDKFRFRHDTHQQGELYGAFRSTLSAEDQRQFDTLVPNRTPVEWSEDAMTCHYDCAVEECVPQLAAESYDLIVSRAVLEYANDLSAAFKNMDTWLKPGGFLVHKIDFRDDGMFTGAGLHPLTRFTFSSNVYRAMTSNSYRPNAYLLNDYLNILNNLGYETEVFVSYLLGQDEELQPHIRLDELTPELVQQAEANVQRVKNSLKQPYKSHSNRDLSISGIFIRARKAG